jgi:hypothetical protein
MKSPEQGATTTVWAAVSPLLERLGGLYLPDCGVPRVRELFEGPLSDGFAAWTFEEASEKRLWNARSQLVALESRAQ